MTGFSWQRIWLSWIVVWTLNLEPWFIPHPTGHIGLHSDAIRVCQELPPLLPPWSTPSFVGLYWLCFSSSLLVNLVLSCILVPACTVLAVVCADGPYTEHVQANVIVFLLVCCPWFVVRFWFWPQRLLSCLSNRCPVCSSAFCDVPHPVFLLMLLSMVIHQHHTGESFAWNKCCTDESYCLPYNAVLVMRL